MTDKVETRIGTVDTGGSRHAVIRITGEFREDGELSLTGYATRPGASDCDWGGQINGSLREEIQRGMEEGVVAIEYAGGWDAARLTKLLDIWDRWHLNHMNPCCEHQRALGWMEQAREERTIYHWRLRADVTKRVKDALREAETVLRSGSAAMLEPEIAVLADLPETTTSTTNLPPGPLYVAEDLSSTGYFKPSETKTRGWLTPEEHPDGLLTKPCPECGYRYGTAWKHEDIPADVMAELRELLSWPAPTTEETA